MRRFDASVTVSARADDLARHMRAKDAGQLKIRPGLAPLGIARSFKSSEKGTAAVDVLADSLALTIAEIRGIGNQESAIFLERRRIEIAFMHEVE